MAKRNIIVIGASAGGFEALKVLVRGLPEDLEASIFLVWHMAADVRGVLPDVLNRHGAVHAAHAYDKEPIKPNRIYIAPPDRHMLIEPGHVRVTQAKGEKVSAGGGSVVSLGGALVPAAGHRRNSAGHAG